MSETIIRDNYFLFYSLVMGISVTVLYDLLRIFRRVVKHGDALISLEDLFYWVVVAISVFYMMHEENNGTMRWFAILGALAGMFIYKKLISSFFVKTISSAINFILKYLKKGIHILLTPVHFAGRKCAAGAKTAGRKSVSFFSYIKKKLTGWWKAFKMILCKQ